MQTAGRPDAQISYDCNDRRGKFTLALALKRRE